MNIVMKRAVHPDEFLTPFDTIFNQVQEQMFPNMKADFGIDFAKGAYPKCNVYDYDDKIGIIAEIPGLSKDQLDITVEEGLLTISGDKHGFQDNNARILRKELKHSSFRWSFELSEELDGESVSADFTDGLLSIMIPKKEPQQPKAFKVKIKWD